MHDADTVILLLLLHYQFERAGCCEGGVAEMWR